MQIDEKTKIVASIADKQTKLGPIMHNSAYKYLGLNFVYIPFSITNCKNAVAGIRALNFRGSAVSMPCKQEVIRYLDKIDPVAKKIGAVNTILNDGGILAGYNSDCIGAVEALKEVCRLENKTVILIGAGGVARAIAYGLKKNKCNILIFNRTAERARRLSEDFNLKFGGNLNNIKGVKDYDILINATSVGFFPNVNKSILDKDTVKENKIVMDVVFDPLETPFLKIAKHKNCKIVPGYRMLIYQALFQFELFTGQKTPFEIMEKALLKVLK